MAVAAKTFTATTKTVAAAAAAAAIKAAGTAAAAAPAAEGGAVAAAAAAREQQHQQQQRQQQMQLQQQQQQHQKQQQVKCPVQVRYYVLRYVLSVVFGKGLHVLPCFSTQDSRSPGIHGCPMAWTVPRYSAALCFQVSLCAVFSTEPDVVPC